MATVKCYSGGKCVKTFKNVNPDDLQVSKNQSFRHGVSNGFSIIKEEDGKFYKSFDWRGDFLVEW